MKIISIHIFRVFIGCLLLLFGMINLQAQTEAGENGFACGLSYQLDGSVEEGDVIWSGSGVFEDETALSTSVTVEEYGTYEFVLSGADGEDSVSIIFAEDYEATLLTDLNTLCLLETYELEAGPLPEGLSGQWSAAFPFEDEVVFSDPNSPITEVTFESNGLATLLWIVEGGQGCVADTVKDFVSLPGIPPYEFENYATVKKGKSVLILPLDNINIWEDYFIAEIIDEPNFGSVSVDLYEIGFINEYDFLTYQASDDYVGIDQFSYLVCMNNCESECVELDMTIEIGPDSTPNDDYYQIVSSETIMPVLENDEIGEFVFSFQDGNIIGDLSLDENEFVYETNFLSPGVLESFTYQACNEDTSECYEANVFIVDEGDITVEASDFEVTYIGFDAFDITPTIIYDDTPNEDNLDGYWEYSNGYETNGWAGTVTPLDTIFDSYFVLDGHQYELYNADTLYAEGPFYINDLEDDFVVTGGGIHNFAIFDSPIPFPFSINSIVGNFALINEGEFVLQSPLWDIFPSYVFKRGVDPNLIVSIIDGPFNGEADLGEDSYFTYQPNPEFAGIDSFQYVACAPQLPICDTAWVYLDLNQSFAGEDTLVCGFSLELDAFLPDGFEGEWSGDGDFEDANDPRTMVTVDDYGTYEFTWTINGVSESINVEFYDVSALVSYNTSFECCNEELFCLFQVELLNEEIDIEWSESEADIAISDVDDGYLQVFFDDNEFGDYEINFTISGEGYCTYSDVIDLSVSFCYIPIQAETDEQTTYEAVITNFDLLDNDILFGQDVSLEIIDEAQNGISLLNEDFLLYYEADEGFTGVDSVQYLICIPNTSICDSAWLYVQVSELIINQDEFILADGDSIEVYEQLFLNDITYDEPFTFDILSSTNTGITTYTEDTLSYVAPTSLALTDTLTYQVCILNGSICDTALVLFQVIDAGTDMQVCGDLSTNLAGLAPGAVAPVWFGNLEIDDNTAADAIITAPDYGTYTILWSAGEVNDAVTVEFVEAPLVEYDPVFNCCAGDICFLDVAIPEGANILWDAGDAPFLFANIDSAYTALQYNLSVPGVYSIFFELDSIECPDNPYEIIVGMDGCYSFITLENDTINLVAGSASIGIDYIANDSWIGEPNFEYSFPNAPENGIAAYTADNQQIVYQVNSDFAGLDSIQYQICNPLYCDSAWIYINVFEPEAGEGGLICEELTFELESISPPDPYFGVWQGNGLFSNPNQSSTSVTVPDYGIYEFYWDVQGIKDTVVVEFLSDELEEVSFFTNCCAGFPCNITAFVPEYITDITWSSDHIELSILDPNNIEAQVLIDNVEENDYLLDIVINGLYCSASDYEWILEVDVCNNTPDAIDDLAELEKNENIAIDILENDSTYDEEISFQIIQGPQNGNYTLAGTFPNISIEYQPNTDFGGLDSILYELCVAGSTLCDTAVIYLTVNFPVSIESVALMGINIYPNPVEDVLHIQGENIQAISLLSVDGKPLKILDQGMNQGKQNINMSIYPSGIYFLQIQMTDGRRFTEKIIKGK